MYGCIIWMLATAGLAQDAFDLKLSNDRVSLEADDAELTLVLQELSSKIGFKLWISDLLQARKVSLEIEELSIEDTLRRLLKDDSYALVLDDNAMVSALYVLPPGKAQSSNLELLPSTDDIRQRVLYDLLNTDSIAENIKATMLNQISSNNNTNVQPEAMEPAQAINRVIEVLERIGSANPETFKQLRDKLELEKSQNQE